jgi:hypothetical protein
MTVKVLKAEDKWFGLAYKEDKPVAGKSLQFDFAGYI